MQTHMSTRLSKRGILRRSNSRFEDEIEKSLFTQKGRRIVVDTTGKTPQESLDDLLMLSEPLITQEELAIRAILYLTETMRFGMKRRAKNDSGIVTQVVTFEPIRYFSSACDLTSNTVDRNRRLEGRKKEFLTRYSSFRFFPPSNSKRINYESSRISLACPSPLPTQNCFVSSTIRRASSIRS